MGEMTRMDGEAGVALQRLQVGRWASRWWEDLTRRGANIRPPASSETVQSQCRNPYHRTRIK